MQIITKPGRDSERRSKRNVLGTRQGRAAPAAAPQRSWSARFSGRTDDRPARRMPHTVFQGWRPRHSARPSCGAAACATIASHAGASARACACGRTRLGDLAMRRGARRRCGGMEVGGAHVGTLRCMHLGRLLWGLLAEHLSAPSICGGRRGRPNIRQTMGSESGDGPCCMTAPVVTASDTVAACRAAGARLEVHRCCSRVALQPFLYIPCSALVRPSRCIGADSGGRTPFWASSPRSARALQHGLRRQNQRQR